MDDERQSAEELTPPRRPQNPPPAEIPPTLPGARSDNLKANPLGVRNIHTTENRPLTVGERVLVLLSYILLVLFFPVAIFLCITVVSEFQRLVIFRVGRVRKGARGPGLVFHLPCVDNCLKVDLRTRSFNVPPQEVLTKDSVTIYVDAVVYFNVQNPLDAVIQVSDVVGATQLLAQTTLRNVAGTKNLTEFLASKEMLSKQIALILDDATAFWGVKVERVEIKDVKLPVQMQRAMAAEAEASREAKGKIVAAEGELKASQALKEASDIMSNNPLTLQLRYLQTLSTISSEKNSTIIFPVPIEFMPALKNKLSGNKQIILPNDMQRAMAVEEEANRVALAKVVAAQGELDAVTNLKEASDVLQTNPVALQLRYLQTLQTISAKKNHTVILPLPMELMLDLMEDYEKAQQSKS